MNKIFKLTKATLKISSSFKTTNQIRTLIKKGEKTSINKTEQIKIKIPLWIKRKEITDISKNKTLGIVRQPVKDWKKRNFAMKKENKSID